MTKIEYAYYFIAARHAFIHICENVQTNSEKSRISRVECTSRIQKQIQHSFSTSYFV